MPETPRAIAPWTDDVRCSDVRTVNATVHDAPLLYTPSGKAPMVPAYVRIEYSIGRREVCRIEVRGKRCDDGRWHRSDRLTRRVAAADAPPWLVDLIEEYRP